MEQQQTYDPAKYPFSSVIDWGKEEEKLSKQKEQQQTAQKRIAKTQMLGDTFKLLAETAGAFGGGDVQQREANPYYLQSVQDYKKAGEDYITGSDNLKQQRYSTLLKDRERNIGLQDQEAENQRKARELEDERAYQRQRDEAQHAANIALQETKGKQSIEEINRKAQVDAAQQAAKEAEEKAAKEAEEKAQNTLKVATYDDPIGTEVDIDRNKALNLLSNFKSWFQQAFPNEELPASANEKNGIIRDDDLIKTIRNYPDFFAQYYPQLYAKGIPEPEKPDENRFEVYDRNIQAAMDKYKVDPSWREARKARVQGSLEKEITRLNGEYADVLSYRDWQEKQADWESATGKTSGTVLGTAPEQTPENIGKAAYDPNTGITDISKL